MEYKDALPGPFGWDPQQLSGTVYAYWNNPDELLGYTNIYYNDTYVNIDGTEDIYVQLFESGGKHTTGYSATRSTPGFSGDAFYYYIADHLGTPQMVVDEQGVAVWEADYAPFGRLLQDRVGAGFHQPLRFPGQYDDPETGLHYNVWRYYDPDTGRYTRTDPLGVLGGDDNLYRYVAGNPVSSFDEYGLFIGAAVAAATIVGALLSGCSVPDRDDSKNDDLVDIIIDETPCPDKSATCVELKCVKPSGKSGVNVDNILNPTCRWECTKRCL